MISLEEARRIVAERVPGPSPPAEVLLAESLGLTLAEEVASDLDLPPFDASAMDGYAVLSSDFGELPAALRLVGESKAGKPFPGRVRAGTAVAIYTGAALPEGADAVAIVERTQRDGAFVRVFDAVKKGENVRRKGEDLKAGEVVLRPGTAIRPQEMGALAALGRARVNARPRPRVAILATGDELVPPERRPGPGEIRESNTWSLLGQAIRADAEPLRLGTVRDERGAIRARIEEGLGADLLLLTGGVSVGAYDLVAEALESLGVENHFHGVSMKPGRPIWFGTRGETAVFGLPGNPVSAFVGFEVLVRVAIEKRQGRAPRDPFHFGRFGGGAVKRNPRLQLVPAVTACSREGGSEIRALEWSSSADLVELARANALLLVPEDTVPSSGETVRFFEI
ncbi:MAG TPA: gephyrin-like molybdotransferase Glp [Planctomycetota bacterium]|nr:gephyrin-like molybdotransferase Glp [Planctomycetota bacterium]